MMDAAKLELEVGEFLKNSHPGSLDEFEVIIRPLGEADINSQNIQNLINAVYFTFLRGGFDSTTKLFIVVRQLAKAFNEKEKGQRIVKIWEGKETKRVGIPVPDLEAIIMRDLSQPGFRIRQKYNYGRGKIYTLAELNASLQAAKTKIFDIFNEIYLKHNLNYSFTLPKFEGEDMGMPKL